MEITRTTVGTILTIKKGKYEATTTTEEFGDVIIDYDKDKDILNIESLDTYEGLDNTEAAQKVYDTIREEMDYLSHKKMILQKALIAMEKG